MKEYFDSVFARTRGSGNFGCKGAKLGLPARGRAIDGPVRRGAKFVSESEAGQPLYYGSGRSPRKGPVKKNG